MAQPKDAEIERLLRRVVKEAERKEEAVTINLVRARVEAQLGLEEGFLKNREEWRGRSKAVIEAAFQEEEEEGGEEVGEAVAVRNVPVKATSVKATPAKTSPAKATPAKATPVKATPAKTTLTKAAPAKATSIQPSPAKTPITKSSVANSTPASKPIETPQSIISNTKEKPKPQQKSAVPPSTISQPSVPASKAPEPQVKPSETVAEDESSEGESEESDEEEEEESEEEDDEDEEASDSAADQKQTPVQPTAKKPETNPATVVGVKRKAGEQDVLNATSNATPGGKDALDELHMSKKTKTASTSGSEEGSEDEDEDGSDEEAGESEGEDEEEAAVEDENSNEQVEEGDEDEEEGKESDEDQASSSQSPKSNSPPPANTIPPIPPQPFKPPAGYTPLPPAHLNPTTPFSQENLLGKQIWHITAPSNLPLSSLTNLSLSAIQSGTPILTHKGTAYIITETPPTQTNKNSLALLVPTPAGYAHIDSASKIDRHLQIHAKITLPNISARQTNLATGTGSAAAAELAQPAIVAVRPQPKGLRMRYKPPGFGVGRPGRVGSGSGTDSAEEDEAGGVGIEEARFQFPRALGGYGSSVGEMAGGAETGADVEVSTSLLLTREKGKGKGKRKRKESEAVVVNGGASSPPPLSKSSSAVKLGGTPGAVMPNGVGAGSVEQVEKARRKEEKRAKKEKGEGKRKDAKAKG